MQDSTHSTLPTLDQMKQYNYSDLRTYVINPNINRNNFSAMPALMRVVWDAYWLAMDMPDSRSARKATAETQQMFLTHTNQPTKEQLVDNLTAYSALKRHERLVAAANQLLEFGYQKTRLPDAQGHKLYSGQWITELEAKRVAREEKDSAMAGPSNT